MYGLHGRNFLSMADVTPEELNKLIELALRAKKGYAVPHLMDFAGGVRKTKKLALLFGKPSLRTRVSLEIAMRELGGDTIYLGPQEVGLGTREPVKDVARTFSRYMDCVALRTFRHETVEEFARYATMPVINALSDREHPCQTLADLLTIYDKKGRLQNIALAFVGDGNNVAASLALATAMVGIDFRIAAPFGYDIPQEIIKRSALIAKNNGGKQIRIFRKPLAAVRGADVVYTDVWTSMGQETGAAKRQRDFQAYQVNKELMSSAAPDAIVMHCLPAHRDEEITDEIIEGGQSVVFDQAENRLHTAKALLAALLLQDY